MTIPIYPLKCLSCLAMLPTTAGLCLVMSMETMRAATFGAGDVTASLGPTFFVDDAATGGSDSTVTQPAVASYIRSFAGLLTPNQGLSRVTLTGFGFATSSAAAENTATSITLTFTYLGADGAVGGGDDVAMGTATGTYVFSVAGEYVFAFDAPLTANLNITGTRFRIQVAPSNGTGNGKVLFKNAALTYETVVGAKFSVAGVVSPQRLNLAKFQAATTDSVSTSVKGQRYASYLTDGVAGNDNRWESGGTAPHWAQVTFPHAVEVGSAQVFSGQDDGGAMTDFKLQYLNGITWTDVPGASVTGNTNVERNLVFTSPVTSTAFRIYNSVDATVLIRELALYPPNGAGGHPIGTDLTLNLARQRPALASANTSGNFALLAVDGRVNKDSKWQTSTAGAQWLEIDLRVSTKIGSAHLYSGSPGVSPLAAFVMRYWDGTAWQNISGGTVAGNTNSDLAVAFTPVTTTKVRLEFTNPGTTSIRELCIFPANSGNAGYPLGTNVIGAPPSTAKANDYHDAFYKITNPAAGKFMAVNSGAPGLSQPGLTTAQGQYQALLNIDTGTYRLRNRATGNCLSGAQLSLTANALLVDAPYSALPDQDWILDPLDGANFQFINQWSGLVIATQGGGTADGTPLVQATANGAAAQKWQIAQDATYPKKGCGGTNFATAFNAGWAYNWGAAHKNVLPDGAVFNPMQWGNFNWTIDTNSGPLWQNFPAWRKTAASQHLLGFNEPDQPDQANFDVATGITSWPRLMAMDMPLVSPAPNSIVDPWLTSFFSQADALGYRIDYAAGHSYPSPNGGSSDSLIDMLQTANATYGRPVWLTEFSFVNWSGTGTWTEEDNYNCLAEFLWRAEGLSWLRKYALFRFKADAANPIPADPWSPVGPRSNAHDANDNITPFGELYSAWDNDAVVRSNKTYHIHNKDTRKRLANTLASTANARNIRTNDSSVQWTLVPKPSSSLYYIVSSRDGRRLSSNGTAVSLVAAGTTGTAVEWGLTEHQHGWFYVEHPITAKRLKLVYVNASATATFSMVANTSTGDPILWRFIVSAPRNAWKGSGGTSWTTAGNWTTGSAPAVGNAALFDSSSTANLATVLNQNFNLWGLTVTSPTGPVSISGSHSLTIGGSGIDMSAANHNLSISSPLIMSALQSWNIASGRTLSLSGNVTSSHTIHVSGAGSVFTGASNILPNGTGAGDFILNSTLDLNGTSQTINNLNGSGVVDNLAASPASLTINSTVENDPAKYNPTINFDGVLQDTNGTLALVKTGTGDLFLRGINTHRGGTTINGTGDISPKTNSAFGSGPVTLNSGTLYATGVDYIFSNALTLNGGTLRVGGANSSTIDWTGPVNVTGDSGIISDGGTAGITITGNMNINGATFTAYGNSVQNTVDGIISGTGTIRVTGSTLRLNSANTFAGTFRLGGGSFSIFDSNALQNATLDMTASSGAVSLNNTWANIGALAGNRNLNLGSNSDVVISIGKNNQSTTYSGVLSNSGSRNKFQKIGTGTLTLSGSNTYNSETRVLAGTLALGANNVLPTTAVTIASATLDAATFTDTVGTLDVTTLTSNINLGSGAALAFANCSAVSWSGGKLNITGTFVPGVSLRFGTDATGLTSTQLGLIAAPGFTSFTLTPTGYLTAVVAPNGYDTWKTQITNGLNGRTQDADGDGFNNLQEFLFGTSPIAGNAALVSITRSGNNLVLRWLQRESGATYTLRQSTTLAAASWTQVVSPLPAPDGNQTGAPVDYDFHTVTLPISGGRLFYQIQGVEN
jgi:autotransporter-associated beta strand protein